MTENLIIFDCDGVLIDSEHICGRIFAETLTDYGYPISTEECIRKFTGINEHVSRLMIKEESKINIPEDYWDLQKAKVKKAYEEELNPLMEPVLEFLEELKLPKCIASNGSRNHILHALECTKQLKYFTDHSIFTAQQVTKPKPAPDLFLFAAQNMGIKPQNCIVIEDSPAGAKAAIAAGMQVLMFMGGSHARYSWYHDLIASHNKPMFLNPHDLINAIQYILENKSLLQENVLMTK